MALVGGRKKAKKSWRPYANLQRLMGKPMLGVGLLACATSCGGLGCAVTADKREVPDVDQYVEKSIILYVAYIRVY